MSWYDLGRKGYEFHRANESGRRWFVIRVDRESAGVDLTILSKLRAIRFTEVKENLFATDRTLSRAEITDIFPNAVMREDDHPARPAPLTRSDLAAITAERIVGVNIRGETVVEANGVRFIEDDLGSRAREADNPAEGEPGRYLRAVDATSLYQVTASLVLDLASRKMTGLNRLEMIRGLSALPGEEPRFGIREFQEAFESAQARYIAAMVRHAQPGDNSIFATAQSSYERQPSFTARSSTQVSLQQFSTPVPLATAAQLAVRRHFNAAIDEGRPYKVYEPSVGHGALISVLAGIQSRDRLGVEFHLNDLDANRLDRLKTAFASLSDSNFNITQRDAALSDPPASDLDLVITNPPFGGIAGYPEEVRDAARERYGAAASRIDQLIALRAMEGLRPGGMGVMILAADSYYPGRAGRVEAISRRFFSYLSDHYRIDGVAEIAGRLYVKNGAAFPVRLIVVTRPDPDNGIVANNVEVPDRLPVLTEWRHVIKYVSYVVAGKAADVLARLGERQAADAEARAKREAEARADQNRSDNLNTSVDDLTRLADAMAGNMAASDFDAPAAPADATSQMMTGVIAEAEAAEANDWQTPYVPASKLGLSNVVVPSYLKEPLERALSRVGDGYADGVDEMVSERLGLTYEELQERFLPHQIDLLALGFDSVDRKTGLIVADQTGMGKGRGIGGIAMGYNIQLPQASDGTDLVQAAPSSTVAEPGRRRRHGPPAVLPVNRGGTVIFVTEKPHLFTDFARDLIDIGLMPSVSPLIVNEAKSTIYDQDGNVLVVHDPVRLKQAMDSGTFAGANMVFMTYSQMAAGKADKRLDWLKKAMLDAEKQSGSMPLLILDEAHNAAGDSSTNRRMLEILGVQGKTGRCPVVYSSATFAKRAENLSIYYRVLPPSFSADDVNNAVSRHGEAILELLTERLAAQGSMVRREHDLSNLTFNIVKPADEAVEEIRQRIDSASSVFELMGYMAGDTDKVVGEIRAEIAEELSNLSEVERDGNRMGVSGTSFGSRLFTMSRQFYMALKTPVMIDTALDTLNRGMRPVVVMEQTMEAAIRNAIGDFLGNDENEQEIGSLRLSSIDIPNDFRVAMRLMAGRLSQYKKTDRRGNVEVITLTGPSWIKAMDRLQRAIDALPDGLPLSPIDTFHHAIEKEGWKFGLISGMSVGFDREGKLYSKPPVNVSEIVRLFRSGEIDSVGLTASGSTGISLHPTRHTIDQRRINLLEWQAILDVSKRVQAQGRVNRTGQTSEPVISTVTTGLSGEIREASVQNNKMRALSAAVTSNRDNPALDRDVPDMINKVGNAAACAYMRDNMPIIRRLGLNEELEILAGSSDAEPETLRPLRAVSKLTGRIHMLPDSLQNQLYESMKEYYFQEYQRLQEEGRDPFSTPDLEWDDVKIERQALYIPPTDVNSPFGGSVMAYEVSHRVESHPMTFEAGLDAARESEVTEEDAQEAQDRIRKTIKPALIAMLGRESEEKKSLVREYASPEDAEKDDVPLTADEVNTILEKTMEDSAGELGRSLVEKRNHVETMASLIVDLVPGRIIRTEDPIEETAAYGIVVDAQHVTAGGYHLAGRWKFKVLFAGDSVPAWYSMASLMRRGVENITDGPFRLRMAKEAFSMAPSGVYRARRVVLAGNLFAAMTQDIHGQLSYYVRPDNGERQRVILLPRAMKLDDLLQTHAKIVTSEILHKYVETFFAKSRERIAAGERAYMVPSETFMTTSDIVAEGGRGGGSRNGTAVTIQVSSEIDKPDGDVQYHLTVPGTKVHGGKVFLDPVIKGAVGEFLGNRTSMGVRFDSNVAATVIKRLFEIGYRFNIPGKNRPILESAIGLADKGVQIHTGDAESVLVDHEQAGKCEESQMKMAG